MPFRTLLLSALLCVVWPCASHAQVQLSAENLPDMPIPKLDSEANNSSSTAQDQGGSKNVLQDSLGIMVRRSFFYPNLASTPGPLTVKEKFELFLTQSISPSRLLGATVAAGYNQSQNSPSQYGQGSEGFAKRFGASMATSASSDAFGTFLLPSLLHQDPRYFVLYNATFRQRVKYALKRVVVTRSDDGRRVFNWSGILGPMMAEGLATTYLPDHEQTVGRTFKRSGIRIGFSAGNNLLKEYWPTIFKSLRIDKVAPGLQPEPGPVAPPDESPPPQNPPDKS